MVLGREEGNIQEKSKGRKEKNEQRGTSVMLKARTEVFKCGE